jgi:glycogen debranching enzyme
VIKTSARAARYAIIATDASLDDRIHVLKADDTFAVLDRYGDIVRGGLGQLGLYSDGTRRLSRFELGIAGHRPLLLSSTLTEDNAASIVDLTNPDVLVDGGGILRRETIHLHRVTVLSPDGLHCQVCIFNYGLDAVGFDLDLVFDADFADVFEVRGKHREKRGHRALPGASERTLRFSYRGLDDVVRVTRVTLDPPPRAFISTRATWHIALGSGERVDVTVDVSCSAREVEVVPFEVVRAPPRCSASARCRSRGSTPRIPSSQPAFGAPRPISRSCSRRRGPDLPYAGVPGSARRSVATASSRVPASLAAPANRGRCAPLPRRPRRQDSDPARRRAGKILHEARGGEMAALGEVPFGRYYGSVDSTPSSCSSRAPTIGERGTAHSSRSSGRGSSPRSAGSNATATPTATASSSTRGRARTGSEPRVEGLGRLRLRRVRHARRRMPRSPWPRCRPTPSARRPRWRASPGCWKRARSGTAPRERCEALRRRFEDAFWCPDLGVYALALDGAKRLPRPHLQLRAVPAHRSRRRRPGRARSRRRCSSRISSRAGASAPRAARERRFNPISYHNGTIWPHDNSLIGAGLARYGLMNDVAPILDGLIEATRWMAHGRRPELFFVFARFPGRGPTLYPVACAPQAWASGALYLLLASTLGLEIAASERRVVLSRPHLPPGLDRLVIDSLEVGGGTVDLDIRRRDESVEVIPRVTSGIDVTVIP